MYPYRRTTLELNSLDLSNLIDKCDERIAECGRVIGHARRHPNDRYAAMGADLASESLEMWQGTRERLREALDRIGEEVDAERQEQMHNWREASRERRGAISA